MICSLGAHAQMSNSSQPLANDPVALYVFKPDNIDKATWTIRDLAPNPLNLRATLTGAGKLLMGTDYLELIEPNMIRSISTADKIVNACKASNALTVEMWLESSKRADLLTNNEAADVDPGIFRQSLRLVSLADTYFKEFHNFGVFQAYDMGDTYKAAVRTSVNANSTNNLNGDWVDPMVSPRETFLLGKKQHIIFVRPAGGGARLYYSDDNGNDSGPFRVAQGFDGNFSNWHTSGTPVNFDTPDDDRGSVSRALDIRLAIGNEASAENDFAKPTLGPESTGKRSRHWPWMGKLYMVAIYCRELSETEILGNRAARAEAAKTFPIDINRRITSSMIRAQTIYTRLTGAKTPIDNPIIAQMADHIDAGNELQAAALATKEPSFYNITVRDMAAKMSTREEVTSAPLSDFVATMIGFTRDGLDARGLLTENVNYIANPALAAVPSSTLRDIVMSNNHYLALENGYDLSRVLMRTTQKVRNSTGQAVEPIEWAGLITSRAFMEAHAVAGTNRRLVEFAFRQFMCTPIEKWADAADSDAYIGRDVDRFPAGSHTKFTNNCRACHSRMDPMRGAFAYFTFSNGFVKHSRLVDRIAANQREDDNANLMRMSTGLRANDPARTTLPSLGSVDFVATKMNHNESSFPTGRVIIDNSFINTATDRWSMSYFEWDPALMKGNGVRDFGRMISRSGQFPRCMAQRVFETICKRQPQSFDQAMLRQVAKEFQTPGGYKLDYLFQKIAITPNCLGEVK